ncbi:MAG TPA: hypothetical protein VGB55_03130, partial [Tepidisphaeraceae bacterium]
MGGDQFGDLARIVRTVGGEKDVCGHLRKRSIYRIDRTLAAMSVTALRRSPNHCAKAAREFSRRVCAGVGPDPDDKLLRVQNRSELQQYLRQRLDLVAGGDDDGKAGHGSLYVCCRRFAQDDLPF